MESDSKLPSLYNKVIEDHFKHPRHYGTLDHADFSVYASDDTCGDSLSLQGIITNGRLSKIAFTGKGCMISQATASLLSEFIIGKSLQDIAALTDTDLRELIQIDLGPNRLRCALLSLHAVQKGIREYMHKGS